MHYGSASWVVTGSRACSSTYMIFEITRHLVSHFVSNTNRNMTWTSYFCMIVVCYLQMIYLFSSLSYYSLLCDMTDTNIACSGLPVLCTIVIQHLFFHLLYTGFNLMDSKSELERQKSRINPNWRPIFCWSGRVAVNGKVPNGDPLYILIYIFFSLIKID